MARVVIVGKTKMNHLRCIGALGLEDMEPYRLLTSVGDNFPANTEFKLGQIWDLDLRPDSNVTRPHTEDVRILKQQFVQTLSAIELRDFIQKRVNAPVVYPCQLFDGRLKFSQAKRAFIWPGNRSVGYSTGFWRFDRALHLCRDEKGDPRYLYCDDDVSCNFNDDDLKLDTKFVGCEPTLDVIPAGTVLRYSLARWEGRPCYLMLSGWFV